MNGLWRILLIVIIAYILFVLLAYWMQRRLLYFPLQTLPSPPQLERIGLRMWPADDGEYRGFISAASSPANDGLVIVFHGNAGAAWQRSYYVEALKPLGYRVLLAEYPGYGRRTGEPSEAALVADAQETLRRAYQEFGGPIYLWGESLGAAVVAAVAAHPSAPVAGLVLLTPWDSLTALAQRIYPFLPVRWLLLDRYESLHHLKETTVPIAVVIAEQDEIIPREHSERLYASLTGPKRRWVLPNAGHNSWPVEPWHNWWREVMAFVSYAP
ncbi:MAG: lysophospholipase [Caldilinea sp.]|nr:lysophospholipase [Caldilinea sp.]MDW8440181.1 alpha/beta fold hydrolase [Caldilineaceae bacterium]